MTGLELQASVSPKLALRMGALIGLLIQRSPNICRGDSFFRDEQSSGTASVMSFCFAFSVAYGSHVSMNVRYFTGEPEIKVDVTSTGPSGSFTNTRRFKQSVSVVQILAGWTF